MFPWPKFSSEIYPLAPLLPQRPRRNLAAGNRTRTPSWSCLPPSNLTRPYYRPPLPAIAGTHSVAFSHATTLDAFTAIVHHLCHLDLVPVYSCEHGQAAAPLSNKHLELQNDANNFYCRLARTWQPRMARLMVRYATNGVGESKKNYILKGGSHMEEEILSIAFKWS